MKNKTKEFDDLEIIILFLYEQINKMEYKGASRFKALKLLYQLKQELPEDHPIQELLPFYWYRHGPYSDIIDKKIKILIQKKLLKIPSGNKNTVKIKDEFTIEEIDYDPNIIDQKFEKPIKKVMKRNIFTNITRIVYKKAPYLFMPIYKLDLWENIEKYTESIRKNDENPDLIENTIELAYKCETKLPSEPYYQQYEDIFSNFLTSLDRIYQNEMADYYYENIEKEVKNVWYTFTFGLRVKHHDEFQFYKNQEIKWDIIFQRKLEELNFEIKEFREIARKSSKYNKIKFSDTSKKILSSTLGTYIN